LDARELFRLSGADGRTRTYTWSTRGRLLAEIHWRLSRDGLDLLYTEDDKRTGEKQLHSYRVPTSWTPCGFGGERVWLVCQSAYGGMCNRRVAKLYKPPGQAKFLCRHCWGLTYASRQSNQVVVLRERAQAIRRRLGGTASMQEPFPERPKGMHRDTYERLYEEYKRLESAMWARVFRQVKCLQSLPPPGGATVSESGSGDTARGNGFGQGIW
jgi:hypothetical protein